MGTAQVSKVRVFHRDDIPEINSIQLYDSPKDLGIVKNLRSIDEISNFIPENSRLSTSWVRLKKGQKLDVHTHPIDSFYIITEGEAHLLGELEGKTVKSGDVILIPKNCKHGFIGAGKDGYWGLSIQFEIRGLYEDVDKPLVNFEKNNRKENFFDKLLSKNSCFLKRFQKNKVFDALKNIERNTEKRKIFLDYFQIVSDHFQKMVLLRSALCDTDKHESIFWKHLEEEFGHQNLLRNSRKDFQERNDPVLEALCVWFTHKMATLDNYEKHFLVQCVIEEAGAEFYKNSYTTFLDLEISHFDTHLELDAAHAQHKINLLNSINQEQYENLLKLQKKAWDTIEAQYERLAILIE